MFAERKWEKKREEIIRKMLKNIISYGKKGTRSFRRSIFPPTFNFNISPTLANTFSTRNLQKSERCGKEGEGKREFTAQVSILLLFVAIQHVFVVFDNSLPPSAATPQIDATRKNFPK